MVVQWLSNGFPMVFTAHQPTDLNCDLGPPNLHLGFGLSAANKRQVASIPEQRSSLGHPVKISLVSNSWNIPKKRCICIMVLGHPHDLGSLQLDMAWHCRPGAGWWWERCVPDTTLDLDYHLQQLGLSGSWVWSSQSWGFVITFSHR